MTFKRLDKVDEQAHLTAGVRGVLQTGHVKSTYGLTLDDQGNVAEQSTPYPGSNLFSLASGGAIFVRDPHRKLVTEQLNGGEFAELKDEDWELILPYLEENERLFGISVENDLLMVGGQRRLPGEVYRKVRAVKMAVLAKMDDTE